MGQSNMLHFKRAVKKQIIVYATVKSIIVALKWMHIFVEKGKDLIFSWVILMNTSALLDHYSRKWQNKNFRPGHTNKTLSNI